MKVAISVTLDPKCASWVENKEGKNSQVINNLILAKMSDEIQQQLMIEVVCSRTADCNWKGKIERGEQLEDHNCPKCHRLEGKLVPISPRWF